MKKKSKEKIKFLFFIPPYATLPQPKPTPITAFTATAISNPTSHSLLKNNKSELSLIHSWPHENPNDKPYNTAL